MGMLTTTEYQLVASGTDAASLKSVPNYEDQFQELAKGQLRLYCSASVAESALNNFDTSVQNSGVVLTSPTTQGSNNIVAVSFQKAQAPLALILEALLGLLALIVALITAWQLFKLVTSLAGLISQHFSLVVFSGVGLLVLVALLATRRKSHG